MAARPLLAASILAADFARLGEAIREAEAGGADRIHIDVMDGHFVPNLSMGPAVVEACRRVSRLPLDVHLMVEAPERFLDTFAAAGADSLTIHVEAAGDLGSLLRTIRQLGAQAGAALNPETPASAVTHLLDRVDQVLIMSVHPGFAGREFLPEVLPKISALHERRPAGGAPLLVVDGGVTADTAPAAAAAGADVFVAASAVFAHPAGIRAGLAELRAALEPAPA